MRLLLVSLFSILTITAFCQSDNDHWEAYMAQYDEGAGSTMVNMSLKEKPPFTKHRFLIITGVRFQNCKDGFPVKNEFDKLYAISDSAQAVIHAKVSDAIHAGSFTLQCERTDYIYVSDTTGIRESLTALYNNFSSYQPIIKLKEDKSWEAYHSFLYPNEEIKDYIANSKVVAKLSEAGDKLDKPRMIDHWLYFKTEKGRQQFITYAQKNGYKVTGKEGKDDAIHPFQLHLTKMDKADLSSIYKITSTLRKEVAKYNGMYDGWESVVVR